MVASDVRVTKLTAVLGAVWDEGTFPSLIYSLAFHAVLLLIALVLLAHSRPPLSPVPQQIVLADLVPLGENTVSSNAADKAPIPQERARETTGRPEASAVPV